MLFNRRILFPVDFSNHPFTVPAAVEALIDGPKVEVILLHVVDTVRPSASRLAGAMDQLDVLARVHFRHCKFRRRVDYGQPASRILDYISSNDIGLAVMPARDSGSFGKGPLGHVASQVLSEAPCPLWLEWRSLAPNRSERSSAASICCAVEGTPPDGDIIRQAAALAYRLGGNMTIISALAPEPNRHTSPLPPPFTHTPAVLRETDRINKIRARTAPRAEVMVATGWREAVVGQALRDRRADLLVAGDCRAAVLAAEGTCPVLRLKVDRSDVGYFGTPSPREYRRIA
jgi:nucleotide-binding universal stress UspA family protein